MNTFKISKGDEVLVMTRDGQMVRIRVDEIRSVGRASKGVRIVRLNEEDKITDVTKVVEIVVEDGAGEVQETTDV